MPLLTVPFSPTRFAVAAILLFILTITFLVFYPNRIPTDPSLHLPHSLARPSLVGNHSIHVADAESAGPHSFSPPANGSGAGSWATEMPTWAAGCDFYDGVWLRDEGYPLYEPGSCPYVDEAFDCQANGRRDKDYMKWRWKPSGCNIPRFNATDFLERLRGKRLMLVGDSVNRNQFESLLCLLREALPDKNRMFETRGYKITKGRGQYIFQFMDYNCTVEFIRSHFLVKEGVYTVSEGKTQQTLSVDRIDKFSHRWKKADIIVFNTGHWWTHGKTSKGKNYFREGDYIHPKFDAVEAFRKAITTWGKWVKENMNPAHKLVFYRGYSTAHFRGGDWDSGGTCNGETEPITTGAFLDSYPLKMRIVDEVLRDLAVPAVLLNVTKMTNFRKDGHPSIYSKIAKDGQKRSRRRQDCSHWCLPGVPDAWNELIYANLVARQTTN